MINNLKQYIVGYDIAQTYDYSAIATTRITRDYTQGNKQLVFLDLIDIDQIQGVPYTDQARFVRELLRKRELIDDSYLLPDVTGVGRPVYDMLCELDLTPLGILFTGSGAARPRYKDEVSDRRFGGARFADSLPKLEGYNVPKEDLIKSTMLMLEQGRLRIAKNCKFKDEFKRQLMDYKRSTTKLGHSTGNAAHDDVHDDIVVAVMMCAWFFVEQMSGLRDEVSRFRKEVTFKKRDWNPADFI